MLLGDPGCRSEAQLFMGMEDRGNDEIKLWLLRCVPLSPLLLVGIFLLLDQAIKQCHGKSLPEPAPTAFSPSEAPNPVELLLFPGPPGLEKTAG